MRCRCMLVVLWPWLLSSVIDCASSPGRVRTGDDPAQASAEIAKLLAPRDWVLVKGSRSSRMERVVEALTAHEADH